MKTWKATNKQTEQGYNYNEGNAVVNDKTFQYWNWTWLCDGMN